MLLTPSLTSNKRGIKFNQKFQQKYPLSGILIDWAHINHSHKNFVFDPRTTDHPRQG